MNSEEVTTTASSVVSDKGSDSTFFGMFDSPLGIIIFIILVFIAILVIWFLFKKFKQKTALNAERRSIKDDLMIWSTLSNLVSGGKKTKKGKEDLDGTVILIKNIFESAIDFIKRKNFLKLKAPWYIILGEPLSGKSSLIGSEALDYEQARKDLDPKDADSIHFWVNRETVFLDVKGKVFFDHWLGGSSAQWHVICDLINKYHHAKPLSGIVLTIPADALIADDKKLTQKKAELISAELARLSATLNMNLPCRIVVTKSDCVVGFREYFASLSDKLKEQIIGFNLESQAGLFNQDDFTASWSSFVDRIKDGIFSLMLSKSVIDSTYDDKNRIDTSANIFEFHHNLDSLKDNLEIYLSTIFDNKYTVRPASVEGVYFTSAIDQGICFNSEFASYQGKKVDDAVLSDGKNAPTRNPLFIVNLFGKALRALDLKSTFTRAEKMRRNVPSIILGATLTTLALMYLGGALASHNLIYKNLNSDADFYRTLTTLFNQNSILRSPLLDVNDKTNQGVTRFNDQMVNDSRVSRINFFKEAKSMLSAQKNLPFIYAPSSYLFFDLNNLSSFERKTIYNQLLIDMAFVPATTSFSYNLLNENSSFTETKADALLAFMYLAIAHERDNDGKGSQIIKNCLSSILKYQYPELAQDVVNLLTSIEQGDDSYAHAAASQILLDPNYAPSVNRGLKIFIDELRGVTAYPESEYQLAKSLLKKGQLLNDSFDELNEFSFDYDPKMSEKDYEVKYQYFMDLLSNTIKTTEEVDNLNSAFLAEFSIPITKALKSKTKDETVSDILLNQRKTVLESSYAKYRSIMKGDFESFLQYTDFGNSVTSNLDYGALSSKNVAKFRLEAINNLDLDYEKLKTTLADVNNTGIFDRANNKDNTIVFKYKLLSKLIKLAYVSDQDLSVELTSPSDFETQFKRIVSVFDKRRSFIKTFASSHVDVDGLPQVAISCTRLINFCEFERKVMLTKQLLAQYPQESTPTQIVGDIKKNVTLTSETYNFDDYLSLDLASEALGYFDLNPEYTPTAVNYYINPIVYISKYESSRSPKTEAASQDEKPVDPYKLYLEKNTELDKLQASIATYADSFVNYWATFPDSVKPLCADYYSFHVFSAQSKAYQINSQLLTLYNFAYDLLSSVKTETLSAKTKSLKEQSLKNIEDRRKSLDQNFTTACSNVLNAWSLLPEDPIKANHYVNALDKKSIRNDYTLVRALGETKGSVPWWTSYVNLGTALLKTEASYQTAYGLEQFQNKLYYFPVLRDASEDSMYIKVEEMASLRRTLNSYGLISKKKAKTDAENEDVKFDDSLQANDEGVDNLQEPLLGNVMAGRTDISQWVNNVNNILTVLSDRRNPLEAKVSIPDINKQQQLIKSYSYGKKYDNAVVRYRYIDIKIGDGDSERFGTVAEQKERVIYDDSAEKADIKLDFYRYSDSPQPDATVSFAGEYAPLRMYLDPKSIYDAKTHSIYLPVVFKDKIGARSMMFLKVSFNKELLRPEDWPSTYNWPLISQF